MQYFIYIQHIHVYNSFTKYKKEVDTWKVVCQEIICIAIGQCLNSTTQDIAISRGLTSSSLQISTDVYFPYRCLKLVHIGRKSSPCMRKFLVWFLISSPPTLCSWHSAVFWCLKAEVVCTFLAGTGRESRSLLLFFLTDFPNVLSQFI